jgi:hypothetical protein
MISLLHDARIAIEKRLESEIARALESMGHVRDRPEGLNEADTKAAFIDPILSALGWEILFAPWQLRLLRSR